MNVAQLFDAPRGPAAKRLLELAGRHNELRAEARELRAKEAADNAAKADLTARLRAAQARDHAFGDAAAEVKSTKAELSKLEKAAGALAEKLTIVNDAALTVDGEVKRHTVQHADALWKELGKDNRAAAERLAGALAGVHAAHAEYGTAAARASELQRLVDPERARHQRVPDLPEEVGRFAKRAPAYAEAVHAPLPGAPDGQPLKPPEPAPSDDAPPIATFEAMGA